MAACPTCFTKVDITAAAVRAAKYASAARDRYERKYRQIKCDVAEAVCASAAEKRTAAGATPCAPTLPVPAFSTGKHSQQWDPQWGPHCDDWDDGDAPQQVVPPGREWDISRDPQCQFTDDESDDGQDPQWHPDSEEWDVPHDLRCRRFTCRGEPDPPEVADVETDADPRMADADQIPPPNDPNRRLNP